jgi:hypothetical protein
LYHNELLKELLTFQHAFQIIQTTSPMLAWIFLVDKID